MQQHSSTIFTPSLGCGPLRENVAALSKLAIRRKLALHTMAAPLLSCALDPGLRRKLCLCDGKLSTRFVLSARHGTAQTVKLVMRKSSKLGGGEIKNVGGATFERAEGELDERMAFLPSEVLRARYFAALEWRPQLLAPFCAAGNISLVDVSALEVGVASLRALVSVLVPTVQPLGVNFFSSVQVLASAPGGCGEYATQQWRPLRHQPHHPQSRACPLLFQPRGTHS